MDNGNGHISVEQMAQEQKIKELLPGATISLKELKRQDGLIAESIDKGMQQQQGVIPSFTNADSMDKFLQIFKHCIWKNTEEQDKAAAAFADCLDTNCDDGQLRILLRLTARSSGVNGELMHWAGNTLTQTTWISRSDFEKKEKRNAGSRREPITS